MSCPSPGLIDDAAPERAGRLIERGLRRMLRGALRSPRLVELLGRRRIARSGGRLAPDLAALLAMQATLESVQPDSGPTRARVQMAQSARLADAGPRAGVRSVDRLLSTEGGAVSLRIYSPAGAELPAIIYFHGGGWVVGSVATHEPLCQWLALQTGCRVMSVRYRLAPEAPFPAAVEDVLAATRAILDQASSLAINPNRLAVAGDSAGGNLAAVVAQHLKSEACPPALQVLIYPAVDATMSFPSIDEFADGYFLTRDKIHWYLDHYRADADLRDPDLSPYYRDDLSGLCPALIYTAGFDPLRDEGIAYAERLAEAGVEVTARCFDDQIHGFANMTTSVPSARRAFRVICEDIRAALKP